MELRTKVLALAVVGVLAGCSGNGSNGIKAVGISMTSANVYDPVTLTAAPGSLITWVNDDTNVHSVKPDAGTPKMDSDALYSTGMTHGQTFSYRIPFGTAIGTHIYYHDKFNGTSGGGSALGTGMAGVIIVG